MIRRRSIRIRHRCKEERERKAEKRAEYAKIWNETDKI